jgi:hypothetical protein
MNGVKEEFCDDWTAWAQTSEPKGFSTQQIFGFIFNVLVFIAMGVGAYIALSAVLREYHQELTHVSAGLGKITAVVFKSLKQKAGDMKGMGNLGAFAALASGKLPNTDAIAAVQAAKDKAEAAAAEVKRKAEESKAAAAEVKRKAEEAADKTAKALAADKAAADAEAKAATEAERKKAEEAKATADAEAKTAKAKADADAAERKKAEEAKAAKKKADEAAQAAADKQKAEEEAQAAAEAERKKAEEAAAAAKLNEARAKSAEVPKPAPVTPPTTPKWKKNQFTNMDYLKQRGLRGGKPKRGRGRVGSTRRAGY